MDIKILLFIIIMQNIRIGLKCLGNYWVIATEICTDAPSG